MGESAAPIVVQREYYESFVNITVVGNASWKRAPIIKITTEGKPSTDVRWSRTGPFTFEAALPLFRLPGSSLEVAVRSSPELTYIESLSLTPVTAETGGSVSSVDGACTLSLPKGSLYTAYYGKILRHPAPAIDDGEALTYAYEVIPADVPLSGSANVSISIPKGTELVRQLGVYYHDPKKGWTYLPSTNDATTNAVYAEALSLETFVVLRDTTPPVITLLSPSADARLARGRIRLKAVIEDHLSGIPDEEHIDMTLDGQSLIFEYHPESHTIFYTTRTALKPGAHSLMIRAEDAAGNVSSAQSAFHIR